MKFSQLILAWYAENKRSLAWRSTKNPYHIWLSEIILQQTRVSQGTPYYLKFVASFPTVYDLAAASEEQVLKLWQGLGYYSRARNLHATAKIVVNEYEGIFPDKYEALLQLKGVGDYTASAIASICFDEPHAVVDGNVYRVLARYFGVDIPINSTEGIRYFKALATKLMDVENIRDYNQAIMEFGAIQCTPKNPNCSTCILSNACLALDNNWVASLPVKAKKAKVRKRFFNYIVPIGINKQGKLTTVLQQRTGKGIWQNLWEFPLIESEQLLSMTSIETKIAEIFLSNQCINLRLYNDQAVLHKLSHQHIYAQFWIFEIQGKFDNAITIESLEKYPVPVLVADFIDYIKNRIFDR